MYYSGKRRFPKNFFKREKIKVGKELTITGLMFPANQIKGLISPLCFVMLLTLTSCKSGPATTRPPRELPLIAVLPFNNQSTDLDAPDKVRSAVYSGLKERGNRLMALDTVDAELKRLGVSEGGQLGAVGLEKLRAGIPADLYCYGDVLDFSFKSLVALSQRKVSLSLRLVSATGETVLEDFQQGINSSTGTDAAGNLALNIAGKLFKSVKDGAKRAVSSKPQPGTDAVDTIADVDLEQETREAVSKLLDKLPGHKNP